MGRHAREPRPPETTVLVIVHLSSIMNYVEWYGVEAGKQLAHDLSQAIEKHEGPVVVMDQGYQDLMEPDAMMLYQMVCCACEQRRGVIWFHHDEIEDPDAWVEGMRQLAHLLHHLKAGKVLVGGLWLSKESGCVRYTRQALTWRRFPSQIVEPLCAWEEHDPRAITPTERARSNHHGS